MGQITTWTPDVKEKFLDWLNPSVTWQVIFSPGGRVAIIHGDDEPLRYVAFRTQAGFILQDPPNLPQRPQDPDAPDPNEQFSTITQADWSMWDTGLPADRLMDIVRDAVQTNDDNLLMAEVERLAFSLSISKLCGWISDLLADTNPRAELWAIAFALGMSQTQGMTIEEKAGDLGITKAALSKRCIAVQKRFGLQPRDKSPAASDSYSEHMLEGRLK